MLDLRGMTVVLTRATGDNADLARGFTLEGAHIIELPCIRIERLRDRRELDAALAALTTDDWLVVTSRHGVDAVTGGPPIVAGVAAIGLTTAERLRMRGIRPAFVPSVATGECLAVELPQRSGRVLLARSDRALPDLPIHLRARGFVVGEAVAYHTIPGVTGDAREVRAALAGDPASVAIALSSPSALDALIAALGADLVSRATLLAGGPTTQRIARQRLGPDARIEINVEEAAHVAHR